MAVQSANDNVVSRLSSPMSDTSEELSVNTEFTDKTVPPEGWLLIGNDTDLRPSREGTPPSGEVVKYTSFTRNGDGTSTFGKTTDAPLERGVGNSNAQSWDAGTTVGLAQSAQYVNLILDAIIPQDDGTYLIDCGDSTS